MNRGGAVSKSKPSEPVAAAAQTPPLPPSIELAWGCATTAPGDRSAASPWSASSRPAFPYRRSPTASARCRWPAWRRSWGSRTMSLTATSLPRTIYSILMSDTALGGPPEIPVDTKDWRAGLTAWAVAVRTAYRRHPWALRVPISGPAARAQQRGLPGGGAAQPGRHRPVRAAEALVRAAAERIRAQRGDPDRRPHGGFRRGLT